jgi:hypothetical protein
LDEVLANSKNFKDSGERRMLSTEDVVSGLRTSFGITVYGYDEE